MSLETYRMRFKNQELRIYPTKDKLLGGEISDLTVNGYSEKVTIKITLPAPAAAALLKGATL
jgi:hypothetical protein